MGFDLFLQELAGILLPLLGGFLLGIFGMVQELFNTGAV